MRKILAVAAKEFVQVRRDPLSLAMLLGVPAMMIVLYGYALNFDVRKVGLGVVDRDRTAASRALVDAFVGSTYFEVAATWPSGEQLDAAFGRREAKAVLEIPEGFGRELAAGRTAPVQLVLDGADATTANTILSYGTGLVSDFNQRAQLAASVRVGGRDEPPIAYAPRVWFNPELRSSQFLVPGLIGFILMLTAVLSTALAIVREKERGTIEQLRATALRPPELILGKVIPYLLLSLAATAVILAAARLLFGVAVAGSYVDLFLATLVYLFGALGFGLLVSTLATSQAMAFQIGSLLSMLPAIFLSGFIFPVRSMPLPLRVVSHLVPARYYLEIARGVILKGATLEPFLDDLLALVVYAAAVGALAWVRLTRREG